MKENNIQATPILLQDLGMLHSKGSSKYTSRYGLYLCYCGNKFTTRVQSVKHGSTKSCGCYNKQMSSAANTRHGLHSHILYDVWSSMVKRCYSVKYKSYKDYGFKPYFNVLLEDKAGFEPEVDWAAIQEFYKHKE